MTEAEKSVIEAAKEFVRRDGAAKDWTRLVAAVDALTPKPDLCEDIAKAIWRKYDQNAWGGESMIMNAIRDELRARGINEIADYLESVARELGQPKVLEMVKRLRSEP